MAMCSPDDAPARSPARHATRFAAFAHSQTESSSACRRRRSIENHKLELQKPSIHITTSRAHSCTIIARHHHRLEPLCLPST